MKPNKVCPVLIRGDDYIRSILVFRHPSAGIQLVKGGIEPGESAEKAAIRELFEETGITSAVKEHLGVWDSGYKGQIWAVLICEAGGLEDRWVHRTKDGGGNDFSFFWHPLEAAFDAEWHPLYRNAIVWIKRRITPTAVPKTI